MSLKNECLGKTPAWVGRYFTAYKITRKSGEKRTVFYARVPLTEKDEAILFARYHIPDTERTQYYRNLAACIQHSFEVSQLLKEAGVQSILTFSAVEQEKDEDGAVHIYLETEDVWPVTHKLMANGINAVTALDMATRLATILRDTANAGVVLRGLDLREAYLNAENKIRLGGFFYASHTDLPRPPAFLSQAPRNIQPHILAGAVGSPGTDIQALSSCLWNLFSGLPFDAKWGGGPAIYPEYAPETLTAVLRLGLGGRDEDCNAFRRGLSDVRRKLNKTDLADRTLPVRQELVIEYTARLEPIPTQSGQDNA